MQRRARQGQPVANSFREFVIRKMLDGGEGERKKEERWWSREGREREREEERERATKTNQKETYQNSIPNEESTPDSAIAIIKAGSRRKKAAKWRTAHRGTLDQRACLVVVSGPVFLDSLVDLVPAGLTFVCCSVCARFAGLAVGGREERRGREEGEER